MKLHHRVLTTAIAAALFSPLAQATNGYQLIGVGSYQKSLGGAVTANPGSAMTAVSNPAGAARVGARADFSMESFMPDRSVDFAVGNSGESAVDMYGVPALGWTAPTSDGSDIYFGGGMYGTSGMGVDYAPVFTGGGDWDGYSNIAFWQMAPVLAWNIDEKLSVGASLNIDYQSAAFKMRDTGMGMNFDLSRAASSFGFGIGLGVLYDVSEQLTVGVNYKSKQNFSDLEYQLAAGDITGTPAGTYKLDLDFPQQAAVGVAFKPNKQLTISADLKWINWSDTMDELQVKGPGFSIPMATGWDDQLVYAVGIAYVVNDRFNLRVGYNYSESPIEAEDVDNNYILPAIVESHYTIGGDYTINNRWQLGFHYMVVPENSLTSPASGTEISLSERSFGANIGYRF